MDVYALIVTSNDALEELSIFYTEEQAIEAGDQFCAREEETHRNYYNRAPHYIQGMSKFYLSPYSSWERLTTSNDASHPSKKEPSTLIMRQWEQHVVSVIRYTIQGNPLDILGQLHKPTSINSLIDSDLDRRLDNAFDIFDDSGEFHWSYDYQPSSTTNKNNTDIGSTSEHINIPNPLD